MRSDYLKVEAMRRSGIIFLFLIGCVAISNAQYRGEEPRLPSMTEKIQSPSNMILGFLNLENFHMSHTLSMGYSSFGGQGIGMSMYTNSMSYQISEPLSVRADVSVMFTPFGSLTSMMKQDANKVFLQRAQIDYRPSKEFGISLQYRDYPLSAISPMYGGYGIPPVYGGAQTYGIFGMWSTDDR